MKKLNLHYVIFILIIATLFGVDLAHLISFKNKNELRQYAISNPIQVILIDDAYYFPYTNNPIINSGVKHDPELARQRCQSMQIQDVKLIYKNGYFVTSKGELYLPFKARHFSNFFTIGDLKEKFQTFCDKHF